MRTAQLRIGPGPYLVAGITLFALKFGIDRLIARGAFGRGWSPLNYLIPNQAYSLASLPPDDRIFYLVMLAVAVPFATVGLILTIARLRDARLSTIWAGLFFVPVVNLLFFTLLGVLSPARPRREVDEPKLEAALESARDDLPVAEVVDAGDIAYVMPDTPLSEDGRPWPAGRRLSFFLSAIVGGALGPICVLLGVVWLRNYGWGLFVGTPFVIGMVASVLHQIGARRTMGASMGVAALAGGIGLAATIAFALEGLGCLIMLIPLATPLVLVGGAVGHAIMEASRGSAAKTIATLMIALPLLMGAESLAREPAKIFNTTTSIVIDAPPSAVWEHVVHFGQIDPPTDWLFRTGIAYPIRARIDGSGVGAIRYCEFSTGPFVEPITVWDAPRLLKFDVTHNPPPLREWGPFDIHPPHLENFLKSHGGEFRLIDLGDGRTRVEGTTWYQHTMWPEAYWGWWSEYVIHRIHSRVLEHVKASAEG